jgi:hypothetical protein
VQVRKETNHELPVLQGKEMHRRMQEREKEEIEEEKEMMLTAASCPSLLFVLV